MMRCQMYVIIADTAARMAGIHVGRLLSGDGHLQHDGSQQEQQTQRASVAVRAAAARLRQDSRVPALTRARASAHPDRIHSRPAPQDVTATPAVPPPPCQHQASVTSLNCFVDPICYAQSVSKTHRWQSDACASIPGKLRWHQHELRTLYRRPWHSFLQRQS